MYLYNTETRQKEEFIPLEPDHVTMYVCGPTVYSYAHIGNARPAVVFDVMARVLRRTFKRVTYVRNITDIDDKINNAAKDLGVPISTITEKYIAAYHADLAALGVLAPDQEPRATDHIPEIITMIEDLIQVGHAYSADGHVLFDVPSYPGYGELSNRDQNELLAGARIEVAPYKRNPSDFVLWKPSTNDLPGWESPWGRGRPGWHIECSVMVKAHLGKTIDIHGGGHDLIFPHHENERAQSVCAHENRAFARYWLHNGFVNVDSEKMSKSIGNILLVRDLLAQAPGEVIRLALLNAHYRAPLDWGEDTLLQAGRRLDGLYQALRELTGVPLLDNPCRAVPADFIAALNDDLNTPQALAELSRLARAANSTGDVEEKSELKTALVECGRWLGLLQQDPENWFAGSAPGLDTGLIDRLIVDREQARADKDYVRADAIRLRLEQMDVLIEDGADGTRWRMRHGPRVQEH